MMNNFLFLILVLILFCYVFKKNYREDFNENICNGFSCKNDNCSITNESKYCNDRAIFFNNTPNCYFNKVVDPNNVKCVDFCVKTYTWKPSSIDNTGQDISTNFINEKKHQYFSSKCNECIDNHYDRIMLLNSNNVA